MNKSIEGIGIKMTDMDFKAAINAIENGHIDNCDPNFDHLETIQTSLRIADRLSRGEATIGMIEAWQNGMYENIEGRSWRDGFKATAQMIKEEQEND